MPPCIISVSRRTDIPAHYGKEFLTQLNTGRATVKNPFGGQTYQMDLQRDAVACFVFWSKDFRPFFPMLDRLDQRGDAQYFLYTITGLARGITKPLEPNAPDPSEAVATLQELSQRTSPKQIAWRFDPIIFSQRTPVSYWLDTFGELSEKLRSHVHRCIFSFCDYYRKVDRRLNQAELSGWNFREGTGDEKQEFIEGISTIAAKYQLRLETCCENGWAIGTIKPGSCVDAPYLATVFPDRDIPQRRHPTRKECGCWESRDIGTYATCQTGCPYCYAL